MEGTILKTPFNPLSPPLHPNLSSPDIPIRQDIDDVFSPPSDPPLPTPDKQKEVYVLDVLRDNNDLKLIEAERLYNG